MSTPGGTCLFTPSPFSSAVPYSREPSRVPSGRKRRSCACGRAFDVTIRANDVVLSCSACRVVMVLGQPAKIVECAGVTVSESKVA